MMLDPKHLLQFVAVLEHRSFTKAADVLGMTQPGLTRNINLMEQRLGAVLLLRNRRKMQPTALGLQVLEQAQQVEQSCRRVVSAVENHKKGYAGEILAGCTPTAANYLIPKILTEFTAQQPKLRLDIRSSPTRLLEKALLSGEIDVEFGPPSPLPFTSRVKFTEFFRYRMLIVSGKKHPLVGRENIEAKTLERQKWIMHRHDTILRQMANNYLQTLGVLSPARTFDLPSNMVVSLLEQGEHLSVVPDFIFRDAENQDKIAPLQVERRDSLHPYGSNILSDKMITPALEHFIIFMRDRLATDQKNIFLESGNS